MVRLREARAGALAAAPLLFGVVPFGLVAGATPVAQDLGGWSAVGLSTLVFAGASQLAIVDVLGEGGSALVAILAAWTINLRMVLYSASLAPHLAHEPTRRRLAAAYVLVDQNYALSLARWATTPDPAGRLPYFLGAGALLWTGWQAATIVGVLVGAAVPEDVPLDFAVPLVFLVLLPPLLTDRPGVVAAVTGGLAAVVTAELGGTQVATLVGSVVGIAAGVVADLRKGRRAAA